MVSLRRALPTLLVAGLMAIVAPALVAQELAAGTPVLAQPNTDTKFFPATIVKKALDGYTVKFEDERVEDVLQADLAFAEPADPAKLAVGTLVAANSYGDFYPGRVYEVAEGSYTIAWESSGTDKVALEDLRLRMAPRSDPRPTPPPPPPVASAAQPSPAAPAPGPKAVAPPAPAAPPPAAKAPPAAPPPGGQLPPGFAPAPPPGGGGDDNPLAAILGMAGDTFKMKYSLVAPTKSDLLAVKTALADITLDIPPDYVPVGLDFKIKNKSGKPLTIDWSKCYVTSFAGAKHAVFHGDYGALEDIPAVEKPTELAAGAEATFSLMSRDGLVTIFRPAHWDGPNWIEKFTEILNMQLFYGADLPNALSHGTSEADQAKDLELMRKNVIGKSFRVGIALAQGGTPTTVEFTVRIDDLQKGHDANVLDSIGGFK